jgi:putative addiction module component (TIGR02574 family)
MTTNEAVIEAVRKMPKNAPFEEIVARLKVEFVNTDADEEGELTQEEWEEALVQEVTRRMEDMKAGRTVAIPHEEVMRQLREKYG